MNDKWIDLSVIINQESLPYPGDPKLKINWAKSLKDDGYNISDVALNMHIGTHADFKKHVLDKHDLIKVNDFIGNANVIQINPVDHILRTQDIESNYKLIEDKESILIIASGHEKHLNTEAYYNQPKFERSFYDFLRTYNIKLIGSDLPSYEYKEESFLEMHKQLLSNNIYLIENLVNLKHLSKKVLFIGLPLPIEDIEASLIRAVAKNI